MRHTRAAGHLSPDRRRPDRLIFDNASGVGMRVSEYVRMAEVFLHFKAHNGFEINFCNL
jgi:hypothetical protein